MAMLNVPLIKLVRHLIQMRIKCHFFITINNSVRSNKMIEMYLRILIIKILLCILSPPSIME